MVKVVPLSKLKVERPLPKALWSLLIGKNR